MAKLKSLTDLRFFAPFPPFNILCSGLRRFRVAPLALLLAAGVGWSAPAASAQAVNFGNVNVCPSGTTTPAPCNKTLAVSFTVPASGTLGTPEVFTQGAPNLDFTLASGSTCTGSVTEGATCAVNVTFTPLAPGQREGGVQLVDGSGNVLANTYIYGTGVGPAIAFSPSAQTTLGSGFNGPNGVAVDGSGNVFVADWFDNAVKEILAVNSSIPANPTINTLGSGFSYPSGVVVDGSGNVFVADVGNNAVKEILAVNGSIPANPTIRTLTLTAGPNSYDGGLTVDESGNVFVAPNQALEEILAVNGSIPANPTIRTFASNFIATLGGVAVDGSENVFFTDFGACAVYEILAFNGSIPANPTINTVFRNCSISAPNGVAVDGAGDVFIDDYSSGKVYEFLAVNGSIPVNPILNTLASGFSFPGGAAVDGSGDVFVADTNNNRVVEIQRSQPPSLSFVAISVGFTSSDSPQSIQIQNIGNAALTGNGVLSDTVDFVTVTGPGIVPDCTYDLSLAPGAECNISFDFTPHSLGPLSATLTLSDNALNGNHATQTITLSGTGLPPTVEPSTTLLQFGTIAFGAAKVLPLTITNRGVPGTVTVETMINGPSYKVLNTAQNTCLTGITSGQSCTLPVEFDPLVVSVDHHTLTITPSTGVATSVALTGTASGVGPEIEAPLQFGTIPVGQTEVLPLTIFNLGVPGTVTITTRIDGPSYKILTTAQNTCMAGVATGQSCTLPVEFDPGTVGVDHHTLTITPAGGLGISTVKLYGIAN